MQHGIVSLRLAPDYMASSPLWSDDGGAAPETLGLSKALGAQLARWQEFFEQHYSWEGGWNSPDARDWFDRFGDRLTQWIETERPDCNVHYDRWATRPPESRATQKGMSRGTL